MRLLDKQITRELVGPFLFGVAAFTSVFGAASVLIKVSEWMANGMGFVTAIEIVFFSLPSLVFWTLPMSTLLAVLMGMGRLSGESEMVALFAGGVSLYRIAVPIIVLGALVSGFSILLNEAVAPIANNRISVLSAAVLKSAAPDEQKFTLQDAGTNSRIMVNGGMDADRGILRNVDIVQFLSPRTRLYVHADRAEWAGVNDESKRYRWKLYDGYWQTVGTADQVFSTFTRSQTKEIEIRKTPDDMSLYQNLKPEQMSFTQLSRMVSNLRAYPDRKADKIRQLEVDMWNKLAVPLTSLIFAVLAAPLGIRPHRSSSSVGLGLSILVILLYWVVGRYTWALAWQGNIPPMVGAFAPNIIGIIAAFVLLKRASK